MVKSSTNRLRRPAPDATRGRRARPCQASERVVQDEPDPCSDADQWHRHNNQRHGECERDTVQRARRHLVAIADASGTLTTTSPTLGTAKVPVTDARLVLNADVTADCQGHLHI